MPERHGMTYTPEYNSWCAMKSRCYNPNNEDYYNYGAVGVSVCERWLHSFTTFLADMGMKPSSEHTLDRINGSGDYCPENCRWATRQQQGRNVRKGLYEYKGKTYHFWELSQISAVKLATVKGRLRRGWPIDEAIETELLPFPYKP